MRVSKFIQVDKNILLEYIYDDSNLIGEPYKVLVNIKNNKYGYIAGDTSTTINIQTNQLFNIDSITNKFGLVDENNYSFLQTRDYASGFPLRHDKLVIHLPINFTFGEYIGCYVNLYTFDTDNKITFDISNFYFDVTNINTTNLIQYTAPPLSFQGKLWGKSLNLDIPSIYEVSHQLENGTPKINSLNYNLTNGVGLSLTAPLFIDFRFISNSQTLNSITTYTLTQKTTVTLPQTPEFETLGVVIQHSDTGDYFEIFGVYNSSIGEFNDFINNAVSLGNNYYVQYNITIFEQNIRGKTTQITVTNNFNEMIEYRPIIKYSTTTAIIDVEMRLIDIVDNSQIIRNASYGMLPGEVSKYSLKLSKINLDNANKPKIYNIKSPLGVGILTNSAGQNGQQNNHGVVFEPINVPYPVLIENFHIIAKSDNVNVGKDTFYGIGKIQIVLYPFDNIVKFSIATQIDKNNHPEFLDMSNMGLVEMVIKNTQTTAKFQLYNESGAINLGLGIVAFRIPANKMNDIRTIYNSGINVFYITSTQQNITNVVYTGLFVIYDSLDNIKSLNSAVNQINAQSGNPKIILDQTAQTGTAIVTRKIVGSPAQTVKPNQTVQSIAATNLNLTAVKQTTVAATSRNISSSGFSLG